MKKITKLFAFLLFFVGTANAEYVAYQLGEKGQALPITNEEDHEQIFNILMTYQFPMRTNPYLKTKISEKDKKLIKQMNELNFLEYKIHEITKNKNFRLIFVPTTIYEGFFLLNLLDRNADLWIEELVGEIAKKFAAKEDKESIIEYCTPYLENKKAKLSKKFSEKEILGLVKEIENNKEILAKRYDEFLKIKSLKKVDEIEKKVRDELSSREGRAKFAKITKNYFTDKLPYLCYSGKFYHRTFECVDASFESEKSSDHKYGKLLSGFDEQLKQDSLKKYGECLDTINRLPFVQKAHFVMNKEILNFFISEKVLTKTKEKFELKEESAIKILDLFSEKFVGFYNDVSFLQSYMENTANYGNGGWFHLAKFFLQKQPFINPEKINYDLPFKDNKRYHGDPDGFELIKKAISLEYKAFELDSFVLYRGATKTEIEYKESYLPSLGNSLFAGILMDSCPLSTKCGGKNAVAYDYMTTTENIIAYGLLVSKKDSSKFNNIIYVPEFGTLPGIIGICEFFHARIKRCYKNDFDFLNDTSGIRDIKKEYNKDIFTKLFLSSLPKDKFRETLSNYFVENVRFFKPREEDEQNKLIKKYEKI